MNEVTTYRAENYLSDTSILASYFFSNAYTREILIAENTTRPGIWIPVLLAVLFSLGAIVVLFTFLIKRTLR